MNCPNCGEESFNLDYQNYYNSSKCKCSIEDLIKKIENLKKEKLDIFEWVKNGPSSYILNFKKLFMGNLK